MAMEEIWARVGEWEDGRSVGPRAEERREIREITVKEQFVLWSPFQTPAPIRWAWVDGGNSRDYTRLTLIPLLWSHASSEQKTAARLKTETDRQRRRVNISRQLTMVSIVTALKCCVSELYSSKLETQFTQAKSAAPLTDKGLPNLSQDRG